MRDADYLILTAVGGDKIGLVEAISKFILGHACNIEDSKMAVFCGEFASILLISGKTENLEKIAHAYPELAIQTGLNIWVKTPSRNEPKESPLSGRLTASCLDHPGVVYRLSRVLSSYSINIESMETKIYAAPDTGTPLFRLDAVISLPADIDITKVRARLDEIAKAEQIDIGLSPISSDLSGLPVKGRTN